MKHSVIKKVWIVCSVGLLLLIGVCSFSGVRSVSAANENPLYGGNGTYSVPVTVHMAMGGDNFDHTAVVEKQDEQFWLSFTQTNPAVMRDMSLLLGGEKAVGQMIREENGRKTYTYTLTADDLQSELNFSVYITAMKSTVSFFIVPELSSAEKISETIEDRGERPGRFVPVIATTAGSTVMETGSVYTAPSATAALGDESCDVTVSAYYLNNGVREPVTVTDRRFTLENIGEYHAVYRASSPSYMTSFGNDTYAEYDVTILSKVGAVEYAKFTDVNGVFPEGTAIQASYLSEGKVYDLAAEQMRTIADRFEVFGVGYYDAYGAETIPSADVTLYLQANAAFDRNKIVVYAMAEDGTLTPLESEGYGRYVRVETDRTGTFIVCVPGVAFVMPMWGYVIILAVCVVAVVAAAILLVIWIRKRKKKKKEET